MIEDTLKKIESRLHDSPSLRPEKREELLNLLAELKREMESVCSQHPDQARSIAGFADLLTHEATRPEKNPRLLEHSVEGLSETVTEFESAHPRLVDVVNRICHTLSNLGI